MSVTRNMELRHLSISHTAQLSLILDNNDSWKSLMENIPKNLDDIQNDTNDSSKITRKYSADNIRQIVNSSKDLQRSPTQILLDEWGTSGKKRATVSDLLELLIKVQLYRAADFVAKDILHESPPQRPQNGPGARIDVSLPVETFDEQAIEKLLNNVGYPYTSQLAAQLIEKSIDSLINNNNRDISNAISVDHHKSIFNNSSEQISDQFESDSSESDTDLIKFSAATSTTTSTNINGEQMNVPQPTVFSMAAELSSTLSASLSTSASSSSSSSSSLQSSQLSSDYNFPINLPVAYSKSDEQSNVKHMLSNDATNEIASSASISSSVASSGASSDSNQMNQSTLIPDIDNLQIRDQISDHSSLLSSPMPSMTSSNHSSAMTLSNNDDAKNLSEYIPNLSLLNGGSS